MDQWLPIIIVIATIGLLWFIGKYVAKQAEGLTPVTPSTATITKGRIFAKDLHVADMSNVLIHEAQEIITNQDVNELAYFLARYRPQFVELEEYLANLRSQYFTGLGKPTNVASEAEKISAVTSLSLDDAPESLDFSSIDNSDLRFMIEKSLESANAIDNDFMERYGGKDFFNNYHVYTELANQHDRTLHIDEENQHRKHMELFVETGIAQQGRKIPLKERLEVLSYNQLKDMATELKVEQEYNDKSELAEALAQMPGSTVHLAMIYKQDDIFCLNADPVDVKNIEDEWALLNAYAKLLIGSLKNSFVSFDDEA